MVLRADERTEEETSGRRITRGSWGEQEEQRREEKEGRRGRSTAWWAEMVLVLVTKVMSAWDGQAKREEASEPRWEEDCIRNIFSTRLQFSW